MFLDALELFDPAGTAITVTAASTNVLDLTNARDLGIGDDPAMKLAIYVGTTFTAGGAATLQIQFQGAPDNAGVPGTWTTYAESDAIPLASLVAGAKLFPIDVPHRAAGAAIPRYYRLNYVVATGPFTAGTLEAALVMGRDDSPAYPSGFNAAN